MVLRAAARGVGLFILFGLGAGLIHTSGSGFYPLGIWLPSPWQWIATAVLALALPGLVGLSLARLSQRRGTELSVPIAVFLVALLGSGAFLATFESDNVLVNRLIPFTGIDRPPLPISEDFPLTLDAADDGRFTAVVANETDEPATVWCIVEARIRSGAVFFKEFKIESIPAGGANNFGGNLEGTGDGPYSGGCKRNSY